MKSLNNNLHERIKNWWGKMQKKTRTEKILFAITVILGLSGIIGGVTTGCYYEFFEGRCKNENCITCMPVPIFVILLFIVITLYITQHGRLYDPKFRNLQQRFGDSNAAVAFPCCIACVYFYSEVSRMLIPGSIIPEIGLWIITIGFVIFVFAPIPLLEKIKEIIKFKTASILDIRREKVINKQEQRLVWQQKIGWGIFGRKTLIEKVLFTIAVILGLSTILIGIVSGCYFVQPIGGCNENCKYCVSIPFIATALFMASLIYATYQGKDDSNPFQERFGNNNVPIVLVCYLACAFFTADILQVLIQEKIHHWVMFAFCICLVIFVSVPISWLKKISKK